MEDLATFIPEPRRITVAGQEFAILPLKMRQLTAFAKAVTPLMPLLMELRYADIVVNHPDEARAAVAVATGASPEFLDDLYPDDFMALAGAVFEVNLDFFARRVLPTVRRNAGLVRQAMAVSAGEPALPTSPAADTGLPTASI